MIQLKAKGEDLMTSLVELILVIFVCDSCDSWAERVVEEIFNNISSILMFHHIFAAHVFFPVLWSWYFCWIISCVNFLIIFFLGIPIFGWKCSKKNPLHQLVVFLAKRWETTKVGRFFVSTTSL